MKSTREKVLQTLASHPKSTIMEIANVVGINAISVRHHLTSLQAAGLIQAAEERHGVGRPRLIYSLTDDGLENFPTRYYQLTNLLIQQMKEALPEETVNSIFKRMGEKFSNKYKEKLVAMSLEEKLDFLEKLMKNEGYELEWKKINDGYLINEISCPFYQIGKEHPQICLFDMTLIAGILGIPPEIIEHSRNEESFCKFRIPE
jgi:DeoR family suf operon transcriptional repressor